MSSRAYSPKIILDDRVRAKIVDLHVNHDVSRGALAERYGCHISSIDAALRSQDVEPRFSGDYGTHASRIRNVPSRARRSAL